MKQKIKALYLSDVVYQLDDFKRLLNIDEDDEIILHDVSGEHIATYIDGIVYPAEDEEEE